MAKIIKKEAGLFLVESSTKDGEFYEVMNKGHIWGCNCKSFEFRKDQNFVCKHILTARNFDIESTPVDEVKESTGEKPMKDNKTSEAVNDLFKTVAGLGLMAGAIKSNKTIGGRDNTMYAHYGLTSKEYFDMLGEIYSTLMQSGIEDAGQSDALDKLFPALDAKMRLKAHGYFVVRGQIEAGIKDERGRR